MSKYCIIKKMKRIIVNDKEIKNQQYASEKGHLFQMNGMQETSFSDNNTLMNILSTFNQYSFIY